MNAHDMFTDLMERFEAAVEERFRLSTKVMNLESECSVVRSNLKQAETELKQVRTTAGQLANRLARARALVTLSDEEWQKQVVEEGGLSF